MFKKILALIQIGEAARDGGASLSVDGDELSIVLTALYKLKLDLEVAREALHMLATTGDTEDEVEDLDPDTEGEIE